MSKTVDMTGGNPTKHILTFALPLIVTNIGQQLYMIADAAIVGRGVGVQALAAVGATDWCYWLVMWTVTVLTQGFSTFVSRYFGEKNYPTMNKTIAMSVVLCAGMALVLTVGGLAASKPLLRLLNTPEDIFDGAALYLMTMISGTVIVTAYNMSASILRALGDGRTPMIAMVIAALLNIGLDCFFVFMLHWGIFGAALASLMAQLVSFLYCLMVLRKVECIDLTPEIWKPDRRMLGSMLGFGLPVAIQSIVTSLGGIILQSSINVQGSAFIAGYTATNKVYGLLESSAISPGLSCSTFVAQNYGAGLYERVRQGVRASVRIVILMAMVVSGAALLFREPLLQLFLDVKESGGPEALAIAVRYLTIMACSLIILYFLHVFRNALQAMGIAKWSLVSGIAELIARIGMSKAVIHIIGSDALFLSEPVAWLGALLSVLLPYLWYQRTVLRATNITVA